jgi:multidrug resistance efflux pump
MENGWTERIEELTKSRDDWKREWRLLNAGLNMAEDKIKKLEAEVAATREALGNQMQCVGELKMFLHNAQAELAEARREIERLREVGWHGFNIAQIHDHKDRHDSLSVLKAALAGKEDEDG